ncbi:MAG: signal peptidase I [Caulobacteraceae bacterium]|nr:signal peptidase I [Caulobacteraceae bacterium]
MSKSVTVPSETGKKAGATRETIEMIKTIVYALLIALIIRTVLFQPYTIPSASEEPNLYRGDYIIVSKWSYGYSRHSILFSPPLFNGRLFFRAPKRGDIIVFKLPRDGHTDYIKRLIGLPGDRIQMRGGQLYINGNAVAEQPARAAAQSGHDLLDPASQVTETNPEGRTYLTQRLDLNGPANNTGEYVVPRHCYFMMGDNRDNSADSRFDPGLAPEDPKLGGCGWDSRLDAFLPGIGVGFVPEDNLVGKAQIIMLSWNTGVDDADHSKATLFKPWTWVTELRPNRFLRLLK